jgi:hypothetical protein
MDALDVLAIAAAGEAVAAAEPAHALAGPTRLSTEQRWSIVTLHKVGWGSRRIARQVACNPKTVLAVLARYAACGSPLSGSLSGRPRITSTEDDENMAIHARVEKFTSPVQCRRQLDFSTPTISPRTIDRRMQEAGLPGRVARKKLAYNPSQRAARIAFARKHQGWSEEQWMRVLFSDEKCFYGKGFCGQTWVRRPPGEAFNPEYCVPKTAHPIKVNVWGCFSAAGPGYLHIFYDNLDSATYRTILDDHLLAVAKRDFPSDSHAIIPWHFLQDNAPMHKTAIVSEWFHRKGVSVLEFPAYSPDLNPIENLWSIMAREVNKRQCGTVEELSDVVLEVWNETSADQFRKLARSMPRRCAAVLEANGWHTKY